MWCYVLIVIGALLIQNLVQQARHKRGFVPKKSQLLRRSRWSIILAGISVITYIFPIREYQAEFHAQVIANSLWHDTLDIIYWEKVPVRFFQEGLYSRAELDVLEADYRNLRRWMDDNSQKLHEKMKVYSRIEVDSLSIPVPKSKIGDGDLTYYRESFLKAVNVYNQDVLQYYNVKNKRKINSELLLITNYIIPFLIIIAMALQLNVVFWDYYEPFIHAE